MRINPRIVLATIAAAVCAQACGGSDKPPTGVEPVVVPPTLTPGSAQTFDGVLNSTLDVAPSVVVRNQYDAPVVGVWVKWSATAGKLQNDSSQTDANGRASAGAWMIDTIAGLQTVTARTGTGAGAASVVAMTARIAPGPLARIIPATTGTSAVVGTTITTPVSVRAVDRYGNGVSGVFLQFAMWSGEGTISGTQQTTDANGVATVGSWKLGTKVGTQSIRADDHRTGFTTLVQVTALPAPASQLVILDGNAQTGQANKRICTSPAIAVRDQYGNGVGMVPIVFTPSPNSGTVTNASVTSAANTGYAAVGSWTLSSEASQTLTVSSPSVPGVTATITATVGPAPGYSVCVRYVGDVTPRVREAVTSAVTRWQRVIVGHTQTTQLTENANRCFDGAPALNEMVEDLLVFVQVTALDGPGNSVARAGACTIHVPSSLAQMGVLQLDSADIQLQLGQGTLDNMVRHEFGHVLGFGTLWFARGLLSDATTDNPFFNGASARAEFTRLFPGFVGPAVPVENTGVDIVTRNTHWRRSVFNTELMQGFSSANMPLSSVTIGAMGDLGYSVDLGAADPYVFPGAAISFNSRVEHLHNDIADLEIWGVDPRGRRTLVRSRLKPFGARP
ncbi:MAG: leishmanolysin-related zinc metalloendopeptidase [Gemmatimonas sp.]